MEAVDKKIIGALNEALAGEMNSIYQYFIHAEMCDNWGYSRLARQIRSSSIQEMNHAEKYVERILFFGEVPHVHSSFQIQIGKDVPSQLENDLKLETEGVASMNSWITMCSEVGDDATRDLFGRILLEEEKHVDWLEKQLSILREIGISQFLSQQLQE